MNKKILSLSLVFLLVVTAYCFYTFYTSNQTPILGKIYINSENGREVIMSDEELNRVIDGKVGLGANEIFNSELKLSKSDNKVVVHTCREYFDKIEEGFGAYTTYDKSMESFFIDACQPVYFLLESQIPKNTNFDKEVFSDLEALPSKMGEIFRVNRHFVCDDEPNLLACLKARMSPYEEVKKEQTPTSINMKSEHEAIGFDILARSDFNKDGWEDLFISYYNVSLEASWRVYGGFCLEQPGASISPVFFNCFKDGMFEEDL